MRSFLRLVLLPILAFLGVACGNSACTFHKQDREASPTLQTASKPKASMAAKLIDARIQPAWQQAFTARATALQATEAWGLFSEAGYVDDGQIMIFVLPSGTAAVESVAPGARTVKQLASVSAADLLLLRKEFAFFDELDDFIEPAFDSIQREAVHLVRVADNGPLDVKTRFIIVQANPRNAPRHVALIDSFIKIRQARTKN
ncbi:MAG: hypothetical protein RIQ81_1808 [Pseudomonadota bacterium]|jgi:hypothetical protein